MGRGRNNCAVNWVASRNNPTHEKDRQLVNGVTIFALSAKYKMKGFGI
jgi:hypothetical protein